jgi:FtsP/CotA-like multicopper oxidase with cupredoxin domain
MKSKTKIGVKTASGQARFKLLTSTAMVAMALTSMSVMAGAGKVCRENDSAAGIANPIGSCTSGTIGTYYANSPKLRKFVDTLPGLTSGNTNTFAVGQSGNYLSVAVADTSTYPGSEYFIIGVVEHTQWMHSDLQKPTILRGYVQLYPRLSERPLGASNPPTKAVDTLTGQALPAPVPLYYPKADGTGLDLTKPIYWPGTIKTDPNTGNVTGEQVYAYNQPNYLGPTILTMKGTPVRSQMVNLLPIGRATLDTNGSVTARNGDIFLPVDESLGGAGLTPAGDKYPQNRAAFHLHGGDSPWISDGTPHQWITPAADPSPYKAGSRVMNAPDMPFPGEGSLNVYYPNDQSARLMWYHDHTFGLTRQNAYGGEAAGYVIMDAAEMALLNGGSLSTPNGSVTISKAIPNGLLDQIVLVIQDKTFVPDDIAVQDSKWDTKAWGQPGDLWFPHVYEPFQLWGSTAPAAGTDPLNPANNIGTNPAGRWDYAVNDLDGTYLPPKVGATRADTDYGLVAFPDGSYADGKPGKGPSATPESYMDTPVINGVAYPVMNVEPKAYRVRFLNGANDRYFNISLWKAAPSASVTDPATGKATAPNTEVTIIPFGSTQTDANGNVINTSNDPAGIPDPTTAGPSIIQFANESGFLPQPVVHKPTLMSFDINGEEIAGDFYLAAAERADTVIDFSQFAGQTLIMYNDGTAPVPGGDPRYDYYTGNADQSAFGGAPTTQAGYGPNTRTLMQIRVAALPDGAATPAAYDPTDTGGALATELPKVYTATAEPHVVGALTGAADQNLGALPASVDASANTMLLADGSTVPLTIKTIHGYTDANIGRLIAQLGTELPPQGNAAAAPTPLSYIDMPTEILSHDEVQYWWIKNYDVDNHPMHFHLFNVQVLGHRLHTDGSLRPPTPDELGWKETVKNWPGEDVIVAVKPKTPQLPFGLPNSVRTLDPTMHPGATANDVLYGKTVADGVNTPYAFAQYDLDATSPSYGASKAVSNSTFNFGWEYVWHCHILGHEENDLMRPMVFKPVIAMSAAPSNVSVDASGTVGWTDPTPAYLLDSAGVPSLDANGLRQPVPNTKGNQTNEIGFRVERATVTIANGIATPGAFVALAPSSTVVDSRVNTLANANSLKDAPAPSTDYQYQVVSVNEAGESISTVASLVQAPAAVTGLTVAALTARTLTLNWVDASSNEEGFSVESSLDGGANWNAVTGSPVLPNVSTLAVSGLLPATPYQFRVAPIKASLTSYVPQYATVSAATPVELLAPVVSVKSTTDPVSGVAQVAVSWTDTSTGETGYTVERCTGTTAACARTTAVWTLLTATLAKNSTSYLDTPAIAGTTYVYRVKATNGTTLGPVGTSAQVVASPVVAAPTGLSASTATGAVVLTWVDASVNETGFNILRSPQGANTFVQVGTVAKNIVTFTDTTVGSGIAYDYQVLAVYTTTTSTSTSAASNTATVTSPLIAAPVVAANVAAGTMVLNWVDNTTNETAYQITRTDGAGAAVVFTTPARSTTLKAAVGGAVTYTDTTAVPNVAYSYTVKAIVSATAVLPVVVGEPSNSVPATVVMATPGAPTAALTGATKVTVTWADNSNNETGFVVERSPDGVTWIKLLLATQAYSVKAGNAATASYVDTLVAPVAPSSYQYRVSAVKNTGTGLAAVNTATAAQSAVAVLDYSVPLAPTILSATPGATTTVNVAWTDNATNETGFSVQRASDAAFTKSLSTKTAAGAVTGPTGSYLATGLTAGKVYYFRVAATNAVGTSAYSTAVTITAP